MRPFTAGPQYELAVALKAAQPSCPRRLLDMNDLITCSPDTEHLLNFDKITFKAIDKISFNIGPQGPG
jgi:hypothetical protein